MTALYHFLFVPLNPGLVLPASDHVESVYVMTGKPVLVWSVQGKLSTGINFALGVATGITMEFQFGTNWAYYSHYVGDILVRRCAIEGLMAFFHQIDLYWLFFFGWDRLSKTQHLTVAGWWRSARICQRISGS